jgi:transposase
MQPHTAVTPRRVHGADLKAEVLRQCHEPGASVAAVALAHGLNANLVRKWLRGRGLKRSGLAVHSLRADQPVPIARPVPHPRPVPGGATPSLQFVPIGLPPPHPGQDTAASAAPVQPHIQVELRGAHARLLVHWPTSQASGCAAWLGQLAATVLKP